METGTIINQYKIISSIGKGGMGEVFLAAGKRDKATEIVNELEARYATTESGAGGIAAV